MTLPLLELRFLGDPILRARAAPVETFDDELRELAEEMIRAMYVYNGVGLAAPQVGRSIRLLVVDAGEARDGSDAFALVNPEIVEQEGKAVGEEGCLSIPGVTDEVERAARVRVRGFDVHGALVELEATDLLARVLQHEIDHLNGILFIDRLGPLRRRMALRAWQRHLAEAEARSLAPQSSTGG